VEHTHRANRFQLECSGWAATSNWTKGVTDQEVAALVRAFGDAALAAQEDRSAPIRNPRLDSLIRRAWTTHRWDDRPRRCW
jgi:hypothetical protein